MMKYSKLSGKRTEALLLAFSVFDFLQVFIYQAGKTCKKAD